MDETKEVVHEESVKPTDGGTITRQKTATTTGGEEKATFQIRFLIYYLTGAIEILLAFRFVFKLLGANPDSGFVSAIYSISGVFLAPFFGIFRPAVSEGVETSSVLEPATLIAMVVFAVAGWGIGKLLDIKKADQV